MTLPSALARIELEYLSDMVRRCADAVKDLDRVSTLREDAVGGTFEKSLRVKAMIDTLELQAQKQPSWETLAALISSEYRLWILNVDTPLRLNPFLSHWVEAVLRLEAAVNSHSGEPTIGGVSARDAAATRLEMIKRLLGANDVLATATPQQMYDARYPGTPFDVRPYVRMLEEEGVYDPSSTPTAASTQPDISLIEEPTKPPRKLTFEEWKRDFVARIRTTQVWITIEELTHLPIALPTLDFLTTLITDFTLARNKIDYKTVISLYTQHALRLIEYMGQPPERAGTPPPQTDVGLGTATSVLDHGQEAQSRAIRLLLLFLKNLIRRGLVDVAPSEDTTLYYEIQEICVRYVWIREVREFRTWIDEGETTEEGE